MGKHTHTKFRFPKRVWLISCSSTKRTKLIKRDHVCSVAESEPAMANFNQSGWRLRLITRLPLDNDFSLCSTRIRRDALLRISLILAFVANGLWSVRGTSSFTLGFLQIVVVPSSVWSFVRSFTSSLVCSVADPLVDYFSLDVPAFVLSSVGFFSSSPFYFFFPAVSFP